MCDKLQSTIYFRGVKGVRLFQGWALIRGGIHLIIMCLGWALIRGWAHIRGVRLIEVLLLELPIRR